MGRRQASAIWSGVIDCLALGQRAFAEAPRLSFSFEQLRNRGLDALLRKLGY
jgi:hypothetical protein